jgi:hypothetical protein
MATRRQKLAIGALICCQMLAAGAVGAQQADVTQRLAAAAPDAQMLARFEGLPNLTLADLHRVAQRMGFPFYGFWARSPAIPGLNASDNPGQWRGQSEADWVQTMCRVRIHVARALSRSGW